MKVEKVKQTGTHLGSQNKDFFHACQWLRTFFQDQNQNNPTCREKNCEQFQPCSRNANLIE